MPQGTRKDSASSFKTRSPDLDVDQIRLKEELATDLHDNKSPSLNMKQNRKCAFRFALNQITVKLFFA